MSEISTLALALKKNKTTVTELKAAIERELNEAMSEIDALIRHTENLETILKEKWQITENKEKIISDLEIEITNFEGAKAQVETQITNRNEELLGLGREKDNLQSQLEQKQIDLDGAKRKLDQLTQDTKDQQELITNLKGDLENVKNEHEKSIADLRVAYENENMRLSQIHSQHKALRFNMPLTACAFRTAPTWTHPGCHHMVPFLDRRYTRPNIFNHARGLVTKHQRQRKLEAPYYEVKVRVTETGISSLDQNLIVLWWRQFNFFNAYWLIIFS